MHGYMSNNCAYTVRTLLRIELGLNCITPLGGCHRCMINELKAESEFSVGEDGKTFSMLLDAMYAKGVCQPPITMDNVEILLELSRKYDVTNVFEFCDLFLSQQLLTGPSFGKTYGTADKYRLKMSLTRCREHAVGHFRVLSG